MVFVSFVLIIIGVVFLLKNLGLIDASAWSVIWPLLIVVLGIKMSLLAFRFHRFMVSVREFMEKMEGRLRRPFEE